MRLIVNDQCGTIPSKYMYCQYRLPCVMHLLELAAPKMASGVLSWALREGDGHLASSCLFLIFSESEDIHQIKTGL